ncbi:MAG: hypothetical protein WCI71_02895, partial [Bacteroidota bacterium]
MKTVKQLILLLILGILVAPSIPKNFLPVPVLTLNGVGDPEPVPPFSWKMVANSEARSRYKKAIGENFGFRTWLIKLKNQTDFSVFNMTEAPGVVIGKHGCLFIESYIKNYTGLTFKGPAKIDYEVSKLEAIQDELKKKNIDFLLIFAPGKATFSAEDIPDRYRKQP